MMLIWRADGVEMPVSEVVPFEDVLVAEG
jgi:hypothetical protein